jgi:Raf kinase inhibitor-like YbhB/YbcL family protein
VKLDFLILTCLGGMPVTLAAVRDEPRRVAIEELKAEGTALRITSSSFNANAPIPPKYADYGEKISPALSWTGVPASAKSLVLMVEDPAAQEPRPFVHWVLFDLPPSITSLPEAVPGTPRLPEFGGALQGRNSRGTIGYFGPRPPKGDPAHEYHFQVFAVDSMLNVDPASAPGVVLSAMKGRVVGRGELTGTFQMSTAN